MWVENNEPIAWAEELIGPARAVDHPRLPFLCVTAPQCYFAGRIRRGCSSIGAAAAAATERIINALLQQRIRASAVSAVELNAALEELSVGLADAPEQPTPED